jgi:hypothetical protein
MTNEIHPIRDSEIRTLRGNVNQLWMALEPGSLPGDEELQAEIIELLDRIEER